MATKYTMSKEELLQELLWYTRFGQTECALKSDEEILDVLEYYLDSYTATLIPYKEPIDHLVEALNNFLKEIDNYTESNKASKAMLYRLLDPENSDKDGLDEFFMKHNINIAKE